MKKGVYAAIIKNQRLLLVRDESRWLLPGGKIEPNESQLETLCRETQEELAGTQLRNIRYFGEFRGKTPRSNKDIATFVYLAEIKGELLGHSNEILETRWIEYDTYLQLSDITRNVLNELKKKEYL